MDPALDFLTRLFGAEPPPGSGSVNVTFRLLRRAGHPFLFLPRQIREAGQTLELYAAQTLRARLARAFLGSVIQFSLPWPREIVAFRFSPEAPFVAFLRSLLEDSSPPRFGILAGNPLTPGQRFLLLCFSGEHQPLAVVKASVTQRGHELIQHEQSFLSSVPSRFKGIPAISATFRSPEICAFAMPFAGGKSPRAHDEVDLPLSLNSWVDVEKTVLLSEMAVWRQLQAVCAAHRTYQTIAASLGSHSVHPCVQHGDFAPWNIKISSDGSWTVFDWERGEITGVPGWDWFHYVIQTAILVKREETSMLMNRVETLLASASFKEYASRAGILGFERELLLSYLINLVEVIQPSEARIQSRALLTELAERWRS